jgi:hypothetical membrane protein
MNIFDKFYEKTKGGYFAFLTLLAVGFGIFVALFIYLPDDPSYSILSNYISDLGAGPIGSRIVFGIGMVLGAIFMAFLILYISIYLKKKEEKSQLIWGFQTPGLIAEVGLILIGIFPLDQADTLAYSFHFFGEVIFFGFIAISIIYFGFIEYKNSEFPKIHAIISFLTGIFSAIFIIGFVVQELVPIPKHTFVYLSEWTFLVFVSIWLVINGIYFWKKRE